MILVRSETAALHATLLLLNESDSHPALSVSLIQVRYYYVLLTQFESYMQRSSGAFFFILLCLGAAAQLGKIEKKKEVGSCFRCFSILFAPSGVY